VLFGLALLRLSPVYLRLVRLSAVYLS